MKSSKRNVIKTRLNDEEYSIFLSKVMQSNLSQSEFIRAKIFRKEESIPVQDLLDKILDLEKNLDALYREIIKKEYVILNLAVAIIVELIKKEGTKSKDVVAEFVTRLEKEAEELYSKGKLS